MKNLIFSFPALLTVSILLTSCGKYESKYDYRLGQDGLIYNSNNDGLYTGTIIDTADVVIEMDVVKGIKTEPF